MAQRYTVTMTHAFPEDDGEWVRADDHEQEVARLRDLLAVIWHAMNDDSPPDFPMAEIERQMTPNV